MILNDFQHLFMFHLNRVSFTGIQDSWLPFPSLMDWGNRSGADISTCYTGLDFIYTAEASREVVEDYNYFALRDRQPPVDKNFVLDLSEQC